MVTATPRRSWGSFFRALARDAYCRATVALSLTLVLMWSMDKTGGGQAGGSSNGLTQSLFSIGSGASGRPAAAASGSPLKGACPEGWVLPQIAPAMRERVEEVAGQWYREQSTLLRKAYNAASEMKNMAGPVREPDGHKRFDVLMPAVDACPSLTKIGSEWDGGKLICGLDSIPDTAESPCVVYSIGGNNQWDFEADIVKRTSCAVFTFDCTIDGKVPPELQDRVEYHKVCLGTDTAGGKEGKYMTLKEIMAMLGHDHITLLKMDIEGYEYDVFDEILASTDIHLPEQISFEIHYETQMKGLDWWGRQRTGGEMALFSRRLYEAGYRVISREDNSLCDHCSEYTVVRFQCPRPLL